MGICSSCHSTSLRVPTAKLILPDGTLHQFSNPVKVIDLLHNYPSTFICNSDEMDFDDVVSPIKDEDELQPGQLYFALPLARLKQPLQPEEMAALAVKASAALAKCGSGRRRCFTSSCSGETGRTRSSSKVADAETVGVGSTRRSGGKRQHFKAMLTAIPE